MFKSMRETVKRSVVGPVAYKMYLAARYGEGKAETIKSGPLQGKKWVRFMRTYNEAYVRGDYEGAIQKALIQNLRPSMTFCDVGANGGFFSLLGATLVGPQGTVFAFEPHPETASQLKRQMTANGLSNVVLVEAAICDEIGTAKFSDDTFSVMASLSRGASSSRSIEVTTTTLDEIFKTRSPPDILKIDIEGSEIDALRGAESLIRNRRPILLVELHTQEIADQYIRLMENLDYRTTSLDGGPISASESGERFVVSTPS